MDQGQKKPVPLSLEDLCLARLISDLEHYPPELLALLPLRLRYRLLANLPVLDLCKFEHNPVAVGVDLDNIWRMKFPPWNDAQVKSMLSFEKTAELYHLSDQDDSSWSWRDRYLHVVATTILCSGLEHYKRPFDSEWFCSPRNPQINYFNTSRIALDWLISLKGYQFLNEGGTVENRYDCQSLTNRFLFFNAECGSAYDRLIPPRYAHYKSTSVRISNAELLTLLMNGCSYKPKCLLDPIPPSDPSPSRILLQREPCDTLKEFLNEVEEMDLTALGHWPNIPTIVLQSVCSGTPPKLRTIQLSSDYCLTRPDYLLIDEQQEQKCYKSVLQILANLMKQANSLEEIHLHLHLEQDVLLSRHFLAFAMLLPSFVSHPQFRALDISNFRAPLNVIGNIVYAFLASPCSHKQTLKLSELVGTCSTEPHLAMPSVAGQELDSGVNYKTLTLHPAEYRSVHDSYRKVCAMLFNFPRIRLNVLEVGCFRSYTGYIDTLHMAAQHPDLRMRSLKIQFCSSTTDCTTFEGDLKALLQVPTLSGLILPVEPTALNPGNIFLPTIARELRTHPRPMQELHLGRSNFLELPAEEVEHLFQTIFSLPELNQLTLKLAYSVLSLQHYKLIHRLWTAYSSGERLKGVICGRHLFMSMDEHTNEFSEAGMIALLESIAQYVEFTRDFRQIYDVRTTLKKVSLKRFHADIRCKDNFEKGLPH